ncbi:MAG: hypothetical protein CMP51_04780 [Flavobacteriales bacterium]|nr:hypothetical protein [Flavobacteriales bacterium]
MRIIYYIFLLISLQFQAQSQYVKIEKDTINIGDQIEISISTKINKQKKINFPIFPIEKLDQKIEILDISDTTYTIGDIKTYDQKIKITSFDQGKYTIPQIDSDSLNTKEIKLFVLAPIISDTSRPFGNTSPKIGLYEDFTDEEIAEMRREKFKKIIIIIAILLIIATLAFFIYKSKNKKGILGQSKKVIIPFDIDAINQLNQLQKKQPNNKKEIKEFHSNISLIIREYLENRFQIKALEKPTGEIIKDLSNKLHKSEKNDIKFVLERADNIKYAKGTSVHIQNMESIKLSIKFIAKHKTKDDRIN